MFKQSVLSLVLLVGAVSCFPESRVVNGTDAQHHYPFMVSLRGPTGSHSCGSSIIAPRWILTAAHCVTGRTPATISIQYADLKLDPATPNVAHVERIIIHKEYDPDRSYANDIALLYLKGRLVFNGKTIGPVKLPEQNYDIPQVDQGAPGMLIGWGLNATGGKVQEHLQEVDLKIYSDAECNERHKGATTSSHICGGVDAGGKGQCSGDSGGPLMEKDTLTQLGIVSWSIKPCAVYPYPGVYTKVSHYINWIHEQMATEVD